MKLTGPALSSIGGILDLLLPVLRRGGSHPVVSDPEGTFDHATLLSTVEGLASRLHNAGLSRGEPVVIHAGVTRWAIAAMLGVMRADAHYVPVDTAFPRLRRESIIAVSGSSFVITEDDGELRVHRRDGQATVRRAAAAYTMFTSGSTGEPKGVVVNRDSLAYSTEARISYYRDLRPETFLLCSSMSFDSSVAGIYWTLAHGGHLVIPGRVVLDPGAIVSAAVQHRPTHMLLLPSLYQAVLDMAAPGELASLRAVIVAGETCNPSLVQQHFAELPTARLFNEYGPTEATVWALVYECSPADASAPDVPIGRPIPGTTIHIRDGELWIAGPGVAAGYANDVDESAFSVVDGMPAYRTGDHVSVDDDHLVHFLGRKDTQLKVAGARIELTEIENLVRAGAGASDAAVGVVREGPFAGVLVAFVTGCADISISQLRSALAGSLPRAAIPRLVMVMPQFPVLPNGKVNRSSLDRLAAQKLEETA